MVFYLKANQNVPYTYHNLNLWYNALSGFSDAKLYLLCDNEELIQDLASCCPELAAGMEVLHSDRENEKISHIVDAVLDWLPGAGAAHLTTFSHAKEMQYPSFWNIDADDTCLAVYPETLRRILLDAEAMAAERQIKLFSLDMWVSRYLGLHWSFGITYTDNSLDWMGLMESYLDAYQLFKKQLSFSMNLDWFFTFLRSYSGVSIESFYVENLRFMHLREDILNWTAMGGIYYWEDGKLHLPLISEALENRSLGEPLIPAHVLRLETEVDREESVRCLQLYMMSSENDLLTQINIDASRVAAALQASLEMPIPQDGRMSDLPQDAVVPVPFLSNCHADAGVIKKDTLFSSVDVIQAIEQDGKKIYVLCFATGHLEMGYCHPNAAVYLSIVSGRIKAKGRVYANDEFIEFKPGERISFAALTDVEAVYIIYGDESRNEIVFQQLQNYLDWFQDMYQPEPFFQFPFEKISVVVQGAIDQILTPICLESIRKFLPGSRIILSTWTGSSVDGLDYDRLVLSKDPGGVAYGMHKEIENVRKNNVNRQLVSVQNGLKQAETEYALKLRTDMILLSNSFLRYFDSFPEHTDSYRLFSHKLIISDVYTRHYIGRYDERDPGVFIPAPFHPSDWYQFGYTEDLKKFYLNTHLMPKNECGGYKNVKYPDRIEKYPFGWNCRVVAEQYYAIQALKNNGFKVDMADWTDWNREIMLDSLKFYMNNYIILDFDHSGIFLPKYKQQIALNTGEEEYNAQGLLTHSIYKKLYKKIFEHEDIEGNIWDTDQEYDKDFF